MDIATAVLPKQNIASDTNFLRGGIHEGCTYGMSATEGDRLTVQLTRIHITTYPVLEVQLHICRSPLGLGYTEIFDLKCV